MQMRLEYQKQLIVNSDKQNGAVLRKNKSIIFFTPLPLQPAGIQNVFDGATESELSIVGHILPEKNRVLLGGKVVKSVMAAVIKAYGDKPIDPDYPWRLSTFTVADACL